MDPGANQIIIRGERKQDIKREDYLYGELPYGKFERRFTLPAGASIDQMKAKYMNGLPEITVAGRGGKAKDPDRGSKADRSRSSRQEGGIADLQRRPAIQKRVAGFFLTIRTLRRFAAWNPFYTPAFLRPKMIPLTRPSPREGFFISSPFRGED